MMQITSSLFDDLSSYQNEILTYLRSIGARVDCLARLAKSRYGRKDSSLESTQTFMWSVGRMSHTNDRLGGAVCQNEHLL